jgi:hypothetical protein
MVPAIELRAPPPGGEDPDDYAEGEGDEHRGAHEDYGVDHLSAEDYADHGPPDLHEGDAELPLEQVGDVEDELLEERPVQAELRYEGQPGRGVHPGVPHHSLGRVPGHDPKQNEVQRHGKYDGDDSVKRPLPNVLFEAQLITSYRVPLVPVIHC